MSAVRPVSSSNSLPQDLGGLRASQQFSETRLKSRNVKDELRENLICLLKTKGAIFPGIIGFEDTVVPQIVNAVLSRQNFILLGLRGQAKSRILRALTSILDERLPYVAGCEIRDNPYMPICKRCRDLIAEKGDATPIAYLTRDERYVEKLATPDVTVADLIGDLDPIKAARGGQDLSNELTMHYGLLPRANRGIFSINELRGRSRWPCSTSCRKAMCRSRGIRCGWRWMWRWSLARTRRITLRVARL